MILTILKGKPGTGKTRLSDIIRCAEGIDTVVFNGSIAYAKMIIKTKDFTHIIIDECKNKEVIDYLIQKAKFIYQITCERIK